MCFSSSCLSRRGGKSFWLQSLLKKPILNMQLWIVTNKCSSLLLKRFLEINPVFSQESLNREHFSKLSGPLLFFCVIYLRERNISDAYVMMLFKQYITKPWFLLVNRTQFSYLNRKRKKSTSRFIISTSNATLGWLNSQGCCREIRNIVCIVSFDARKVVACWSARLSENQRCVVNRSDDTKSASLRFQIEMFRTGNRCKSGKEKPPLVTALTALIINWFFIRNCRSLDLPRDLDRSPNRIEKNHFSCWMKNVNPNNML